MFYLIPLYHFPLYPFPISQIIPDSIIPLSVMPEYVMTGSPGPIKGLRELERVLLRLQAMNSTALNARIWSNLSSPKSKKKLK